MQDGRLSRRLIGALRTRLPEARLDAVEDQRDARGKRWSLATLLAVPVIAMCAGRRSLAEAEALTQEMSPAARRALGLRRRVPDTTMRDAIVQTEPDDVRASLHAQVKAAQRRKALAPVDLPFGVIAMDGKGTATSAWDEAFSQRQPHTAGLGASGLIRTMTCCLTSSAAKVCVDAFPIRPRMNEMSLWMRVIRGHWAVENNCHHTWDAAFREDERLWIEGDPKGTVVTFLLRRLAYNILVLFRCVTQRSEERRLVPWKNLMRAVYNTLIAASEAHVAALRRRKPVVVPNV